MNIFQLPTMFERSVLSVSAHRPLTQEDYNLVTALSVEPGYLQGTAMPLKNSPHAPVLPRKNGISYLSLDRTPDFSRYHKVEKLSLYLKEDPVSLNCYLKILEALPQLTGVKHLELYSGSKLSRSQRILKRLKSLSGLFEQLEILKIHASPYALAEFLPAKLPRLKTLQLATADWQTLSALELPQLTELTLHTASGMPDISAIAERFPALSHLCIRQSSDACIRLGNGLQGLESLQLEKVCTVDLDGIADSNLRCLQLSDCDFDPTPLQEAAQLEQLTVKRCLLEQPMPPLTQPDLYQLDLQECDITDLAFLEDLPHLQVLDLLGNRIPCPLDEETNDYPTAYRFLAKMPDLLMLTMEHPVLEALTHCKPFANRFQKRNEQWQLENTYIAR